MPDEIAGVNRSRDPTVRRPDECNRVGKFIGIRPSVNIPCLLANASAAETLFWALHALIMEDRPTTSSGVATATTLSIQTARYSARCMNTRRHCNMLTSSSSDSSNSYDSASC